MRRPLKSVLLLRDRSGDDVRRIDLPKVVFGFVAWAVAICCVIGFLEPLMGRGAYADCKTAAQCYRLASDAIHME
jgi:hypothetical protein